MPLMTLQTDFQLTRGTKRPIPFTNLPMCMCDMPSSSSSSTPCPCPTQEQEPHKRARLFQIHGNDDHDDGDSSLVLMADKDKFCAQLHVADAEENINETNSSDGVDEIQTIIGSLENDEDTTRQGGSQSASASAWGLLGFDVGDLDQFATSDLMLSVC
jgi:hypothetical protein